MPVTIRIDDVMTLSGKGKFSDKDRAVNRMQQMHRWICQVPGKAIHMPTILINEMDQTFPDLIPWLREETEACRMSPQIHGLEHIDYAKLSLMEVKEHLEKCLEWFDKHLKFQPTIWATPWGAKSTTISAAAASMGIEVQGVDKVVSPDAALKAIRQVGIHCLENEIIMEHWWQKGLRILRIVECLKYGSYEAAKKERQDLFD